MVHSLWWTTEVLSSAQKEFDDRQINDGAKEEEQLPRQQIVSKREYKALSMRVHTTVLQSGIFFLVY